MAANTEIEVYCKQGDWRHAKLLAEANLVSVCNDGSLYLLLAQIYEKFGQLSQCLSCINRSVTLGVSNKKLQIFRAVVNYKLRNFDESIEELVNLNRQCPQDTEVMTNLALIQQQTGDTVSSQTILDQLSVLAPDNESVLFNRAANLYFTGSLDQARAQFERVIAIKPNHPKSCWHLSLIDLAAGNFQRGWIAYESRFNVEPEKYLFPRNRYDSDYCGSVLIWAEQGIGDEIMFGSLLNDFSRKEKKLCVQLDERLIPLFRRSLPNNIEFRNRRARIPNHTHENHISLGSLGQIVRPTYQSFVGKNGQYLYADPVRVRAYTELLDKGISERLIGISWQSSNSQTGRARSLPLSALIFALRAPDVRFVNLQYDSDKSEIEAISAALGVSIWQCPGLDLTNDLDGLAALMCNCDEIVSIGNATAHLAGALGKKTTVLLTEVPNWRWMSSGTRTPWYGSVTVRRLYAAREGREIKDILERE